MSHLIKPENYSVTIQKDTVFNFETNVSVDYIYSIDANQPSLNEKLFSYYIYSQFHPEAVDPKDISKGFISVKNDSLNIEKIKTFLNK